MPAAIDAIRIPAKSMRIRPSLSQYLRLVQGLLTEASVNHPRGSAPWWSEADPRSGRKQDRAALERAVRQHPGQGARAQVSAAVGIGKKRPRPALNDAGDGGVSSGKRA